ncbi:MAG: CAAX geranylgeranyltransferase alpha subunit [Chaenotheca gracillima]|nr:MAG: CAAX geranylgeranyltransferase alpha subunit [Chaenotheca gracillima]
MQAVNYPPHVTHARTSLPTYSALDLIQAFLEESETSPHLHPDAHLTERGPQRSSATEGLTLHNLRRVEAGLRGENLGKDLSEFNTDVLQPETIIDEAPSQDEYSSRKRRRVEGVEGDQWRDKEEYQLHQHEDTGDLVGEEAMPDAVERSNVPRVHEDANNIEGEVIDKDERKRRKKERKAQEKKENEAKRRKQKEMDRDH